MKNRRTYPSFPPSQDRRFRRRGFEIHRGEYSLDGIEWVEDKRKPKPPGPDYNDRRYPHE